MKLRPTQEAILAYTGGRMAVAAVPGSGKTFTLTRLATKLIADGRIDTERNQQILIVTYLNTSVDTFRARIRERLAELDLPPDRGYDVRTLHSLGLEIVRTVHGGEAGNDLVVIDGAQTDRFLNLAIDNWRTAHPHEWEAMSPQNASPQQKARWNATVERIAGSFITTAKAERYRPDTIYEQLAAWQTELAEAQTAAEDELVRLPFVAMLTGIYANYQSILLRQGALDYHDLIGQAADIMEQRPDAVDHFRERWPYVLEDEAQDSVPLQEVLLGTLTGPDGNWVRVGDPNQAVTSTFTAAHPRYLNRFLDREDVVARPLPHTGRCAPVILETANRLVEWVCDAHPVPEVRRSAFRRQMMIPTPEGDAQPNPPDAEAKVVIKVYEHREDEELPRIAYLAHKYTERRPDQTVAVLVPTHNMGHKIAEHLDKMNATYDNLLRGGTREREIASAVYAMLKLMADPLSKRTVSEAFRALYEIGHPAVEVDEQRVSHVERLLQSVSETERMLYPAVHSDDLIEALPAGRTEAEDVGHVGRFVTFLQTKIFPLRLLPIDDLVIALSDEMFAYDDEHINETDLAVAYQIANVMRGWYDLNPDWRLPQLTAELADIAQGKRHLRVLSTSEEGYDPQPGRITLSTQHSAKGLEWDGVFLVGIDGFWIPKDLDGRFLGVDESLGGDPQAEMTAQLHALMAGDGDDRTYRDRTATESAHIEVIGERLRLLYVGITRARRFLHLSRSRRTRRYQRNYDAEPATALGVIYRYIKERGTP